MNVYESISAFFANATQYNLMLLLAMLMSIFLLQFFNFNGKLMQQRCAMKCVELKFPAVVPCFSAAQHAHSVYFKTEPSIQHQLFNSAADAVIAMSLQNKKHIVDVIFIHASHCLLFYLCYFHNENEMEAEKMCA